MDDENRSSSAAAELFDCIIVGAGPGGLQAGIYLGRYRRKVLILDSGGGRTAHARSIENILGQKAIPGKKLIDIGTEQARSFGVRIEKAPVLAVSKSGHFEVQTRDASYRAKFVIISTGVADTIPPIENMKDFFGTSFFTCIDCDGYKTSGRKLAVIGDSNETVRVAFAVRAMYTPDVTLILASYDPPPDYQEELEEQGIRMVKGEPMALIGGNRIEAVELRDRSRIPCDMVLCSFGFTMNDGFLKGLDLKRDPRTRSFIVSSRYESSVSGLYIVGPLNTGNDQAVIAAGEGAVAAIDINKRLLEL